MNKNHIKELCPKVSNKEINNNQWHHFDITFWGVYKEASCNNELRFSIVRSAHHKNESSLHDVAFQTGIWYSPFIAPVEQMTHEEKYTYIKTKDSDYFAFLNENRLYGKVLMIRHASQSPKENMLFADFI